MQQGDFWGGESSSGAQSPESTSGMRSYQSNPNLSGEEFGGWGSFAAGVGGGGVSQRQQPNMEQAQGHSEKRMPTVEVSMSGQKALLDDKIIKMLKCESGVHFMLYPVAPTAVYYHSYKTRIKNPMDFETLQENLYQDKYKTLKDFAVDVRRIFANGFRFNCFSDKHSKSIRRVVTSCLFKFEGRWLELNRKHFPRVLLAPPLPELKILLNVFDEVFSIQSTNTDLPVDAMTKFIDPIDVLFQGAALQEYLSVVSTPMDYGTIISKLFEAVGYHSVEEVFADVALVTANCVKYWEPRGLSGATIITDARALENGFRKAYEEKSKSVSLMNAMDFIARKEIPLAGPSRLSGRISSGGSHPSTKDSIYLSGESFNLATGSGVAKPKIKDETTFAQPPHHHHHQQQQQQQQQQGYPFNHQLMQGMPGMIPGASSGMGMQMGMSMGMGVGVGVGFGGMVMGGGGMQPMGMPFPIPPQPQQQPQPQQPQGAKLTLKLGGGGSKVAGGGVNRSGAPNERAPSPPPQLHPGFPLYTKAPNGVETESALQKRAYKYCNQMLGYVLEQVKKHYIVNPHGKRISTSAPFDAKVETRLYPEYEKFINSEGREEMYLQLMQRKIKSERYGTSISSFLADMTTVRDNAHAFNQGDENIEVRIMADTLLNYCKYLLRRALNSLLLVGDTACAKVLITADLEVLRNEEETTDVITFLSHDLDDRIKVREKDRAAAAAKAAAEAAALEKKKKIMRWGFSTGGDMFGAMDAYQYGAAAAAAAGGVGVGAMYGGYPVSGGYPGNNGGYPTVSGGYPGSGGYSGMVTGAYPTSSQMAPEPVHYSAMQQPLAPPQQQPKLVVTMPQVHSLGAPSAPLLLPPQLQLQQRQQQQQLLDLYPNPDPMPLPEYAPMPSQLEYLPDFDLDFDDEEFQPSKPVKSAPAQRPKKGQPAVRLQSTWEVSATHVMKRITKHPYVDLANMDKTLTGAGSSGFGVVSKVKVIADFFHPVVENFPHLAEEYLRYVPRPMDLSQIGDAIVNGQLRDSDEFAEKLVRVFTNLVQYNSRESTAGSDISKEMVAKGNHLARYCKWLCLENLPTNDAAAAAAAQVGGSDDDEDDDDHDEDEHSERARLRKEKRLARLAKAQCFLKTAIQSEERQAREAIIKNARLVNAAECKTKLLFPLKKTKGKEEHIAMGFFCQPVNPPPSDYAIYVRRPMDLGTIQKKLDLTASGNTSAASYSTYGELIADMRLVFSNAVKYNGAHLEDAASKQVYDAAIRIAKKLEDLLPRFTLENAERVERERVTATAQQKREREEFEARMIQKQELEIFEEAERAKRAAEDRAFAADQDVLAKKARTAAEEKLFVDQEVLKRKAELEEAGMVSHEQALRDDYDGSADAMAVSGGGRGGKSAPRLRGYASGDAVPHRLLPVWKAKRFCRQQAWEAWRSVMNDGSAASSSLHASASVGVGVGVGMLGQHRTLAELMRGRTATPWVTAPSAFAAAAVPGDTPGLASQFVVKMSLV